MIKDALHDLVERIRQPARSCEKRLGEGGMTMCEKEGKDTTGCCIACGEERIVLEQKIENEKVAWHQRIAVDRNEI